ncbi:MerR family transcriptional regulator [Streptosporangium sandarakinum]|uniref:MerR family transcriptional regulator n=1 Tax=Streptosporangium sandarakinum TaxID=1260955 RepID=UPI00341BB803
MEWTIGELAEQATALLGPTAQLSGRVRDVPNERLIRWYATIGLLDPPLTRRGRVALYGRRHLLQLVAVKRRQAEGRTIAEIQAELAGATDRTLEAIADIPEPPAGSPAGPPAAPRAARPRFWATPPAATGAAPAPPPPSGAPPNTPPSSAAPPGAPPNVPRSPTGRPPAAVPAPPPRPAAPGAGGRSLQHASHQAGARPAPLPEAGPPVTASAPAAPPQAVALHGVRLAPGVTLLLDGGRAPSPDDLPAIGAASRALLAVLREHDLIPPEGEQR